jgi:hypothetical protein
MHVAWIVVRTLFAAFVAFRVVMAFASSALIASRPREYAKVVPEHVAACPSWVARFTVLLLNEVMLITVGGVHYLARLNGRAIERVADWMIPPSCCDVRGPEGCECDAGGFSYLHHHHFGPPDAESLQKVPKGTVGAPPFGDAESLQGGRISVPPHAQATAWTARCTCGGWVAGDEGDTLAECACGIYWAPPVVLPGDEVLPSDKIARHLSAPRID